MTSAKVQEAIDLRASRGTLEAARHLAAIGVHLRTALRVLTTSSHRIGRDEWE